MARSRAEGPWGRVVAASAAREAEKGWPAGLTTLTGADLYHLDLAFEAIVGALAPDRDDPFAYTVLRDGRLSPAELVDRAASRGMFASSRIVVLRDVAVLDGDPEPLLRYAADPPDASWILIRASRLDRKRKLHQAVCSGRLLEFRPPEGEAEAREFLEVLSALARERGLRLDARAAAWVAAGSEGDLLRARAALDQLRDAFPGATAPLTEAQVAEIVSASESATGWELGDHLVSRDTARALADARRYESMGQEAIKIVGGLAWRARSLVSAKGLEARGAPFDAIVGAARAWAWKEALRAALRRWPASDARALPSRLLAADRTLKSRQAPPYAAVERLIHETASDDPGRKPR
ncbi:MAG TPA: DNA polymerase III subunit delta [Candidatus Polarisedimenticolaceae bacterium]